MLRPVLTPTATLGLALGLGAELVLLNVISARIVAGTFERLF